MFLSLIPKINILTKLSPVILIIYSLIILISAAFWLRSHPVIFISLILLQTVILRISIWITSSCSWFSFILFLIFLGGLIVLFIYITSLASNELLTHNMHTLNIYSLISITSLWMILFNNKNLERIHHKENNILNFFIDIYSESLINIITLVIVYLLLTLIIAVKISNKKEAPIKSSY